MLRNRLLIGLAAGALMAAMLPGAASAAEVEVYNTGKCVASGLIDRAAFYDFVGPNGGPYVGITKDGEDFPLAGSLRGKNHPFTVDKSVSCLKFE